MTDYTDLVKRLKWMRDYCIVAIASDDENDRIMGDEVFKLFRDGTVRVIDAIEALVEKRDDWNAATTEYLKWSEAWRVKSKAAEAEVVRLREALKPRLKDRAFEALNEICLAMEAMDEPEAKYLATLLDWHIEARKCLGEI